ncbi:MAG TPA: dihydroorotate dehydrogenase electron transfer subunit [Blastocatellia bacterium]|nr:dihydroorotate dehydrogenase electron transfer subunit [Blastocatellia bacterium]
MIETVARVESNIEVAPGFRLLTLSFDRAINPEVGQFAMMKPSGCLEPLLRRALAVYRVERPDKLSFLYQVLGRGTQALSLAVAGSMVDTLVPLGNGWPTQSLTSSGRAIVVAGGIGSASVLMLCERLKRQGVDTRVFFGAANSDVALGCGLEDFKELALPLTVTTDDGSLGERGFVTAPLERHLQAGDGAGATIYTCGPWAMMSRVAELAARFDVRCYASLEAPMGCGFGVCVGCVVAVKTDGGSDYGSYKRVCTDGSIFPAEQVRWEVNAMGH